MLCTVYKLISVFYLCNTQPPKTGGDESHMMNHWITSSFSI